MSANFFQNRGFRNFNGAFLLEESLRIAKKEYATVMRLNVQSFVDSLFTRPSIKKVTLIYTDYNPGDQKPRTVHLYINGYHAYAFGYWPDDVLDPADEEFAKEGAKIFAAEMHDILCNFELALLMYLSPDTDTDSNAITATYTREKLEVLYDIM